MIAATALFVAACGDEVVYVQLSEGECFADLDITGGQLTDVEVVDCDEPHIGETYAVLPVAGDDYPGEAALQEAYEDCFGDRFESYVGTDYNVSSLYAHAIYPTEESWDAGDRSIQCFLTSSPDPAASEPLEGSMRGSGR